MKTIFIIFLSAILGGSELQAAKVTPALKLHRTVPAAKRNQGISYTETSRLFKEPALMNIRPMKHKGTYVFGSK